MCRRANSLRSAKQELHHPWRPILQFWRDILAHKNGNFSNSIGMHCAAESCRMNGNSATCIENQFGCVDSHKDARTPLYKTKSQVAINPFVFNNLLILHLRWRIPAAHHLSQVQMIFQPPFYGQRNRKDFCC